MTFALPTLKWLESPNYSERTAAVNMIVCHDCQGGYEGSIATFQGDNGGNPVSAHVVLKEDGSEATQMVAWDKKAWHAVAFNSRSIGLEMAGFEEKGFADGEWNAQASMTAYLCKLFSIPVRWAQNGVGPGIARHIDLGKAGGGHQDPTKDPAVWASFMAKVKEASDSWPMPLKEWGQGCPPIGSGETTVMTNVNPGMKSVSWAQGMLNAIEPNETPLDVDGVFGPLTRTRLAAFLVLHKVNPSVGFLTDVAVQALQMAYADL